MKSCVNNIRMKARRKVLRLKACRKLSCGGGGVGVPGEEHGDSKAGPS